MKGLESLFADSGEAPTLPLDLTKAVTKPITFGKARVGVVVRA